MNCSDSPRVGKVSAEYVTRLDTVTPAPLRDMPSQSWTRDLLTARDDVASVTPTPDGNCLLRHCPQTVPDRTENLVIVVILVGFPNALGAGDSAETRAITEVAETT